MLGILFLFAALTSSVGPKQKKDEDEGFSTWEDYERMKKEAETDCPDEKCPKEKPEPKEYDPDVEFTL